MDYDMNRVDRIVEKYAAAARAEVALEFGISKERMLEIVSDENGTYDFTPEYYRYYERLQEYVDDPRNV